jgi:hypothetical protein
MLIVWIESYFSVGPYYVTNAVVIFATLIAADVGSALCPSGTQLNTGGGTIRDLDAPLNMRTFFSILQFHATVGCLWGLRRYSTQFMYVWIIQFTAFLLTLRRKNIAPHVFLVSLYGFMLTAGFVVSSYEIITNDGMQGFLTINALANGAAFIRMIMRVDKYVLWIGCTAIVLAVRTMALPFEVFVGAYALSLLGVADIFRKANARAKAKSGAAVETVRPSQPKVPEIKGSASSSKLRVSTPRGSNPQDGDLARLAAKSAMREHLQEESQEPEKKSES